MWTAKILVTLFSYRIDRQVLLFKKGNVAYKIFSKVDILLIFRTSIESIKIIAVLMTLYDINICYKKQDEK